MQAALNIAIKAARKAGEIILRNGQRVDSLTVRVKQKNDFVSEVDQLAEREIIGTIRRAYPQHGILAEESGHSEGDKYQWVIDPLDGTTNYLHGLPHYCISIALRHQQRLESAVIYDPFKDELFCASRGNGATLNSRKIRTSKLARLEGALLSVGLHLQKDQTTDPHIVAAQKLALKASGIRRSGSAALDLAYVAAGRLDGCWESGLNIWDLAAGCLIVQEAGGLTGDHHGGHNHLSSGNIIAANPKIFRLIVSAIHDAHKNQT